MTSIANPPVSPGCPLFERAWVLSPLYWANTLKWPGMLNARKTAQSRTGPASVVSSASVQVAGVLSANAGLSSWLWNVTVPEGWLAGLVVSATMAVHGSFVPYGAPMLVGQDRVVVVVSVAAC